MFFTEVETSYSQNICSKRNKNIYLKAVNMITNKHKAKAVKEHVSCDCKWKLNSTTCNSKQKWNNNTCQCQCKNWHLDVNSRNPSAWICENSKYLKGVADTSVTECDEIVIVMNNLSTKRTNTIRTKKTNTIIINVTSTALINWHSKKVRDCYNSHTVL